MSIAENIKAAREQVNMTQEELAEKLDVSRQAVSKWEMGLSTPDREHLQMLSEVFGIDLRPPEEDLPPAPSANSRWKRAALILGGLLAALTVAFFYLLTGLRSEPPAPSDPTITGICFYDETGARFDPGDGAGWYIFEPGSHVSMVVSFADSIDDPVYAASVFLTPTGTQTFNERQQLAVQSTEGLPYVLFGWDIPEYMMGHLEVRLECAGGITVTEELNVGTRLQ